MTRVWACMFQGWRDSFARSLGEFDSLRVHIAVVFNYYLNLILTCTHIFGYKYCIHIERKILWLRKKNEGYLSRTATAVATSGLLGQMHRLPVETQAAAHHTGTGTESIDCQTEFHIRDKYNLRYKVQNYSFT
jgi:hypothetical protein